MTLFDLMSCTHTHSGVMPPLQGRGGYTNIHPGNIRFREKALELRVWYEACSSKEQKYEVSKVLVDCMKAENRRFLSRKDPDDGFWYEVIGNSVRKKASQALRERLSEGRGECQKFQRLIDKSDCCCC